MFVTTLTYTQKNTHIHSHTQTHIHTFSFGLAFELNDLWQTRMTKSIKASPATQKISQLRNGIFEQNCMLKWCKMYVHYNV